MADTGAGPLEIEPVSAAVLASLEHERREGVRRKGRCRVGCREVDERVLMGGLERGVVVGVSSEATSEADFGLRLSLQLITRTLCQGLESGERERVLVVSTEPTRTVVGVLRDAVVAQARGGKREGDNELVKEVLGLVSIVQVFDITGISEVLGELDIEPQGSAPGTPREKADEARGPKVRDEIPDSDDDVSPSPSPTKEAPPRNSGGPPDIILITHFSTLLTTLYTHAEQTAVHNTLHLLSSRLRYLSRSLPSSPLIILTNTTTPSALAPAETGRSSPPGERAPRAPDPSLRSVFSAAGPYATTWQKPSFGLVFAQFLDLHLLCTRIPRTREDAEGSVTGRREGRTVWVVEALLDEGGVWEGERGERVGREGRWGVVDAVGGRVVDAFSELRE